MRRTLVYVAAVAATVALGASPSAAATATAHLSGGGTASFSQVAFNVRLDGSGGASGSFECLMAGRSAFILANFPGLEHNMIVHATPTAGRVDGSVVNFSGPARLTLDGSQKMDVHIQVQVDVAHQMFELTVVEIGPMGPETFMSGGVSLR